MRRYRFRASWRNSPGIAPPWSRISGCLTSTGGRVYKEVEKALHFGYFQLRDKPQRPGRNPKTGEEIPITARRVVTFHASQKLKALVEQTHGKQGDQG